MKKTINSKEDLLKAGVRCEYIDTHTHTNTVGSDGELKPFEQIQFALKMAFAFFKAQVISKELSNDECEIQKWFDAYVEIHWSITDHNTSMAYEKLMEEGVRLPRNFNLHLGVELEAVDSEGRIFDVILSGIGREFRMSSLGQHYLKEVVNDKANLEDRSAEIQYKAFLALGFEIPELLDPELRYRVTGIRANDLAHDTFYRRLFEDHEPGEVASNVRKYLLEHGYDPSKGRSTYYRNFITNPESEFYVDQTKGRMTLSEIAEYVFRETDYKLLVAHPGIYDQKRYGTMEEFIHRNYQILAILAEEVGEEKTRRRYGFECGHRGMTLEQTKVVKDFCKTHGLIYAAESDFHAVNAEGQVPFTMNGGKTFITREFVSEEWFSTKLFEG